MGEPSKARLVLRQRWREALRHWSTRENRGSRFNSRLSWLGRWFLQLTVGNGYAPFRILFWAAGLFAIGLLAIEGAVADGALVPTADTASGSVQASLCASDYPCLDKPVYVLDVLLPIIDLGESAHWRIDDAGSLWWRIAYWGGILSGWTFSGVFIAAFTPAVRRE